MLILGLILLILSNAVNTKRDSSILYSRSVILILIHVLLLMYLNLYLDFINYGINLYGGLFTLTKKGYILHIFLLTVSIIILCNNEFYKNTFKYHLSRLKVLFDSTLDLDLLKSKYDIKNKIQYHNKIIEYPLIILFCIIGGLFLISSSNLISIFLSLELQSYALYLICSIYRDSENSVTGGLTYFLLGGLSSCIILLGQGLLYINTGTTNLENIYLIINIYNNLNFENVLYINNFSFIPYSLTILSIGFLFKISAAPFHF